MFDLIYSDVSRESWRVRLSSTDDLMKALQEHVE